MDVISLLALVPEIHPVPGAQLGASLCQSACRGGVKGPGTQGQRERFCSVLLCVFPVLISHSLIHLGTESYWFQVSCLCRIKADTCPDTQGGILVSHFSLLPPHQGDPRQDQQGDPVCLSVSTPQPQEKGDVRAGLSSFFLLFALLSPKCHLATLAACSSRLDTDYSPLESCQ